ncbi:hypothetical protein TRAPUB_12867 [Trametes pubescens]|uniref:Uncharacterized protein n=1 Tax=Trametes pubescens TaxID=154538 RepID=A0A1M2VSN0_TRAPU|nr:hypothetical protein TRAPUB_12867 [Trametes pubescens]
MDEKLPGPFYGLPAVDIESRRIQSHPRQAGKNCLVDERRKFELELLSWSAVWNAELPIHCLPAEVLLHIFTEFLLPINPSTTVRCAYSYEYNARSTSKRPWTRLMGVCRHWCALIRNAGCFWGDIVNWDNPRWLKIALSRLGKGPLRVWLNDDRHLQEVVPILLAHADHLKHLNISVRVDESISHPLAPILNNPLPVLASLQMSLHHPYFHDRPRGRMYFPDQTYPSLTSLELTCVTLSWTTSLLGNLRVLSLSNCELSTPSLALSPFLDILQHSQHLEELSLDRFLSIALSPQTSSPHGHLVTLPQLRRLHITETPLDIAQFMGHIHVPDTCSIRLAGRRSYSDTTPVSFIAMLPQERARATFLRSTTDVTFVMTESDNAIYCRGQLVSCELDLRSSFGRAEGENWLDTGLRQLTALFGHGECVLTRLEVTGRLHIAQFATWHTVLDGLPALQTLVLCGHNTFPSSAAHALAAPSAVDDEHGHPDRPRVCCPSLKHLDIRGWDWRPATVEAILDCLGARAALGASELESLDLTVHWERAEEERVAAWAPYLPRLRGAVGRFDVHYSE